MQFSWEDDSSSIGEMDKSTPSSWSGLFSTQSETVELCLDSKKSTLNKELKDSVSIESILEHSETVKARGLVNQGNMCYMNSVLQVLVFCAPFRAIFKFIKQCSKVSLSHPSRMIEALINFFDEFQVCSPSSKDNIGDVLLPIELYSVIYNSNKFVQGNQEDAEEFLGFLLDSLHEELLVFDDSKSDLVLQQWLMVKGKNQVSVQDVCKKESLITNLFGGVFKSFITQYNGKESITMEPFHCIQLDINGHGVNTVEDALLQLATTETIDSTKKQTLLSKLPEILVLHFKRFIYQNGEIQKLDKFVHFPETLIIEDSVMSSDIKGPFAYSLFGLIRHHGLFTAGGHYTCHVKQCEGKWLNIDDEIITDISIDDVLSDRYLQTPYLLFYQKI